MKKSKSKKKSQTPVMTPGKAAIVVEDSATTVKQIIWVAGTLLAAVFGWLQLKGEDFLPVVQSMPGKLVFHVTMILYFSCWISGTLFDTDIQALVYVKLNKKRTIRAAILAAITLLMVFAALCWADTYRKFCVLLAIFFLVNIILVWQVLMKRIVPEAVADFEKHYGQEPNYMQREELRLVAEKYLLGAWQWYRFALGSLIILIMNLMAFSNLLDRSASAMGGISPELLQSASALLFVLAVEGWIWYMRLRLSIQLRLLKEIKAEYQLEPIPKAMD